MLAKSTASKHPQKGFVRGIHLAYSGLLATCLLFTLTGRVVAAESPDMSLQRLEQKFFQHSYPKDTETDRIQRIEKMVFGETKTGSDQVRLQNLVQAIPADGDGLPDQDGIPKSVPQTAETPAPAAPAAPAPRKTAVKPSAENAPARTPARQSSAPITASAAPSPDSSKYPAVTAIETKVLSKSYESEPIEERLNRLEAKVFGKPSRSDNLIDRVDRLRQNTGIDVAARPPRGSDWTDDDDDVMPPGGGGPRVAPRSSPMTSADGEDGMSFSGRNLRKDMQQAFGGMSTGGGAYGMGNRSIRNFSAGGTGASGSYGFGDDDDLPPAAPQIARRNAAPGAPNMAPSGMGLNQQVAALENEVLGKTYAKEALPERVSRLEAAVFPADKTAADKPLPERVSHLVAVIPISGPATKSTRRIAQRSKDPDFPDLDDDLPQLAPQRGGLSRIVNSMSNMMNGGFAGGYPMAAGGMTTDPGTGLLIDRTTGNLIDPTTGMVVGRRVTNAYGGSPYMAPGYGIGGMGMGMPMGVGVPMGAYPSFGNGFSSPGSGMRFGIGGGGMGIGGTGTGVGVSRGFGMWP